jgi:DNA-binding NarL/FixJ family response regulator
MSGIEMQKELIAHRVHTPIVYITSHDDPGAKAEALGVGGCAGYFRKTDDGQTIIEAIRRAASS